MKVAGLERTATADVWRQLIEKYGVVVAFLDVGREIVHSKQRSVCAQKPISIIIPLVPLCIL